MRIPHVINENLLQVYSPSSETLDLVGECERLLIAENFSWNQDHIPSLTDFCVRTISKHFEKYPDIFKEIPCENKDYLFEILSTNLPFECAVINIDEEFYWKRRYEDKFGTIKRRKRSMWNWKNCYVERHVREMLEQAQPQYDDEQFMGDVLILCQPYVKRVIVTQLQVWKPPLTMQKEEIPEIFPINHIDFQYILRKLPSVSEVAIVIGMNNVGETFTWNMFEVSVLFFQRLGKALLDLPSLKTLRIHRCKLEYAHCQALIQIIMKNDTLVELDLSNCDLGDDGALCVAKFLMNSPKLKSLNLTNNNIHQKGAEGIGFSLLNMNQRNFQSLDLRLNPLRRDGTMGILRALVRCSIPRILSLSGCLFDDDIPERVAQMIEMNDSLKKLDISNNWFGDEGGDLLVNAMEENSTIESIDMRGTDVTSTQMEMIRSYVQRNKTLGERGAVSNVEKKNS